MGGACSTYGERRAVYMVLVEKPKRPLGSPRRRWEDNIKMDLQEVGLGVMDWIVLAQDRDGWRVLVNVVMNLRVTLNAGSFVLAENRLTSQEEFCSMPYVSIKFYISNDSLVCQFCHV
jgi:hypothetical protein